MVIRLEKKGIRALGVAESFKPSISKKSTLAAVVMRSDRIVDGFVFGEAKLKGDDATDSIVEMFRKLRRNDINVVMLGGVVLSQYNIVDVDRLGTDTATPVVAVTFEDSRGIQDSIKKNFPRRWREKLKAYRKLGGRDRIVLSTGHHVYVRTAGMTTQDARRLLDKFTIQGSIPEPIRLAKNLARSGVDFRLKSHF